MARETGTYERWERRLDCVFLKGLKLYGRHGVHPEETRLGQRFELDIEAFIDLTRAGSTDDLHDTVSYTELFTIARDILEGPPRKLLESVADAIATTALDQFPSIASITVEIRKPSAPIETGGLDCAGVRITRTRADR
jgi:7,8-dihydroneopterin aldolase/epimerase/oxygenase